MIRTVFRQSRPFHGARFATCVAFTALALTGCGGSNGPELQSNPFESAHSGRTSTAPAAPVATQNASPGSTVAAGTDTSPVQSPGSTTLSSPAATPASPSSIEATNPVTEASGGTSGLPPVTDAGLPANGTQAGTVTGQTTAQPGTPGSSSLPASPPTGSGTAATTSGPGSTPIPATDAGPKTPVLSVDLPSGRNLDLRQSVLLARAEFETRLQSAAKSPHFIKVKGGGESSDESAANPQPTSEGEGNSEGESGAAKSPSTVLYISRINGSVRGPVAVFYADGSPMVYASYDRDSRRDEPVLSWDEQGRLQFYQEFASGKAHGLSCVFAPIGEDSEEVTLRIIQEWARGKLKQSYYVTDDGKAIAYDNTNPLPQELYARAAAAQTRLTNFNDSLDDNERELRKSVAAYYRNEVRFNKAVRSAAFQQAQMQAMSTQFRMLQGLQRCVQCQQ